MNKEFSEYLDKLADNSDAASDTEIKKTMEKISSMEEMPSKTSARHRRHWYKPAGLIAACAVLVIGAATLLPHLGNNAPDAIAYAAEDYKDVYAAIEEYRSQDEYRYYASDNMAVNDSDMATSAPMEMGSDNGTAETPQNNGAMAGDGAETFDLLADDVTAEKNYSETNNQVKGVDEGDIVKTDGEYIYMLRRDDNKLLISSAAGATSELLSTTQLLPSWEETEEQNYYEHIAVMYISGDRLAVLTNRNNFHDYDGDGISPAPTIDGTRTYDMSYSPGKNMTRVHIYDISNPVSPALVEIIAQDGGYSNSRMIDGKIYVISDYHVYSEPEKNDPQTYVPAVYCGDTAELVAPGDICIANDIESTSYLVVTSVDMINCEMSDIQTMLGNSDIVYMSMENLYITDSCYETEESAPYKENQYTVTDYTEYCNTDIIRFSLAEGAITMAATGQVPGYLESQFSMDEYNGYLRLVLTDNTYSYSIYKDENYGWENYESNDDGSMENALYILDDQLQQVGSIEGLAPDERIYSARFNGDIGYFVTFRETDPLFTVDLSDPTAPVILSELKIPGFSEYLHVYGEGRLFGLGMDADEETGMTNGMKLTMFDTSDPADVTEKHTLLLESAYSEALYNHKAILIAPEHDLIAFPAERGYEVYGYNDEDGFYQKGRFESGDWYYDTRGLYVENAIYICGNEITIVHMDTLEHLATLELPEIDYEIMY